MRLFLKDHIDLIAVYLINMILLVLVYDRIDGFATKSGIYYFLFLSTFILVTLLVWRYFRKRKIYQTLSKEPESLEDAIVKSNGDPVVDAFSEYSLRVYRKHNREFEGYQEKTSVWQTHIIQWVHQMKTPISVIRLMIQENKTRLIHLLLCTNWIEYRIKWI